MMSILMVTPPSTFSNLNSCTDAQICKIKNSPGQVSYSGSRKMKDGIWTKPWEPTSTFNRMGKTPGLLCLSEVKKKKRQTKNYRGGRNWKGELFSDNHRQGTGQVPLRTCKGAQILKEK